MRSCVQNERACRAYTRKTTTRSIHCNAFIDFEYAVRFQISTHVRSIINRTILGADLAACCKNYNAAMRNAAHNHMSCTVELKWSTESMSLEPPPHTQDCMTVKATFLLTVPNPHTRAPRPRTPGAYFLPVCCKGIVARSLLSSWLFVQFIKKCS